MPNYVTSKDGTPIAYDRVGEGPPVVIVSGLFCDRQVTRGLAEHLGRTCTVLNYDRRGRGDSGDTPPYAVEREIEDLAVLISTVGGSVSVYGHSSGAGLALHAAASGLPIARLILHEPPYGADDDESTREARQLAERVHAALDEDRRADAIKLFLTASGMPTQMAEGMAQDPRMLAVAPTMNYDFEIMGSRRGGTIPKDLVRAVTKPTLVITGTASPQFFRDTGDRLVELLPHGTLAELDGQNHGAPADVVAPVVGAFLAPQ